MTTRRQWTTTFAFTVWAAGCGNVDPASVLAYPVPASYVTRIDVQQAAPLTVVLPQTPAATESNAVSVDVVVTTARKLDRPTEVVGVIDEHEPSGRQDAALALLRRRAAAMGADGVVGVEFHHGEESGGPTHLSGLAVRYVDRLRPGEWP